MLKSILKRFLSLTMAILMVVSLLPGAALTAFAASGSLTMDSEGLTVSYSGDGTVSGGGTSITANVAGTDKSSCSSAEAKTATITFTNQKASGNTAVLSFSYEITANHGSVKIGDVTLTGAGSYSVPLEGSLNTKLVLTSGAGSSLNTAVTLTNVALTESVNIDVAFGPAENGSYQVGGEAVPEGGLVKSGEAPLQVSLAAAPAAGYKFRGWYSEKNGYIDFNANTTLNLIEADTIRPVFVNIDQPVFKVGSQTYLDLNEANEAAKSASDKQIILIESGVLTEGTYEISSNVKLLVPYDGTFAADFDEEPGIVNQLNSGSYSKPTVYRSLTIGSGAALNCYGQINVNSQMYLNTNERISRPTGPYGAIDVLPGGRLNLESGSVLYAYGYIGGAGAVEAKSGSKIYQMMQICDWRGGSATSSLKSTMEDNSFIFSQYYFQNVEAPLKINSGAAMYAVTGITASASILGNVEQQITAPIIGTNDGLFRMDSGRPGDYILMAYDAATDRMNLELHGNVNTVSISLNISLSIVLNGTFDTKDYILPLPMNYTFHIKSGSNLTFQEKMKLMPGTQVYIEEGAAVNVLEGGAIYLYDADDWNSGKYAQNSTMYQLSYVHATKGAPAGRTVSEDALLQVDGTLNAQGPVYSTKYTENGGDAGITGAGTVIMASIGSTDLKEVNNNSTSDIVTITCVPALGELAGRDGTASYGPGTYHTANGKWYQYTLTGEGFEVVSGAEVVGDTAYVANAVNDPAVVTIATDMVCRSVTGAAFVQTAAMSAIPEYQLTDFEGNAVVTAKDTHTEVILEKLDATCTETGLGEGAQCADCGVIVTPQPVLPMLDHDYTHETTVVEPTCAEQGYTRHTCVCGAYQDDTFVAALGHVMNEGEVEIPAACGVMGTTKYTCTREGCGYTESKQDIPALTHEYGEWVTVADPACTEAGEKQKTCALCQDVVSEAIDALGHALDAGVMETAPTCVDMGSTRYTCTREGCGYYEIHEDIPATGIHTWELTDTTEAPTCTEDGNGVYTCNLCGETTEMAVDATGHTEVTDPAEDPACTAAGKTEGSHCEVCGAVIREQTEIPALGHAYEAVVTAPTCTDQGYTTHTCVRCGDSYQDTFTDPVGSAHVWEEVVTAPDCLNGGYTSKVCTECGYSEKLGGTEVEPLGHDHVGEVTAPTCTDQGYTTYTCHCGDSYVDDYVAALGHAYTDEVTAPTCTQQGYTTHTCTVCGDVTVDTCVEKLPHTPEEARTEPTCTELGRIEYICSACGEKTAEDTPLAALGHSHTIEVSVEQDATCTEQGSKTMQCERCGDTVSQVIPALGHDYAYETIQSATCTADGLESYHCDNCGDSGQRVISARGHTPVYLEPVAPTCTEDGLTEGYRCSVCGETYQPQQTAPAIGHNWVKGDVLLEATCYAEGRQEASCAVCGQQDEIVIEKTPHTPRTIPGKAPTCTEAGWSDYQVCAVEACQEVLTEKQTLDAAGHSYVADPGREPTCTQPGQASGQRCEVCGQWNGETVEIPAKGHTCDDKTWTVMKLPSCTQEGQETNTCTECGETVTRATEKTAHTEEVIPAVAPRYDAAGLTEGRKCSVCGAVTLEQEEVPMLVLNWETFLQGLEALEYYANLYAKNNPGKDAVKLMINYLRTGVDRYTDDSWETMAGAEETAFIKDVLAYDQIYGTHAYALREMDNLKITTPNGQTMVFDHVYGAMNVSSKNNYGVNNTDFGSWVGDLCDLMDFVNAVSQSYSEETSELEALTAEIRTDYLGRKVYGGAEHGFDSSDILADLDAFCIISRIVDGETSLYKIFSEYYDRNLSDEERAAFFLNNRFPGSMTKEAVRASLYETYDNNFLVRVLESSRDLGGLSKLREAACYAYADYLFELAEGRLVEPEAPEEDEDEDVIHTYRVFNTKTSTLAPGVSQTVNHALNEKGEQIVFFMATADVTRDDVSVYANYANNDPSKGWAMASVSAQMNAADANHADDPDYTPVAGVNASFYNMSTGEPTGLLIMNGVTYKAGGGNFFGVLADGTPIIGGSAEYEAYRDQLAEAVAGGNMLVRDGVSLHPNNDLSTGSRAPRTAVGITGDGKVVLVVLDGRQSPYSAGANYHEMAKILADAGCVTAMELDGGGSSTFVAKQEGADSISLVNKPSDTAERSVSSSLMVVSTAPTSKEFDRALVNTPTDYITIGSSFDVELVGVGAAGNMADIPEGAVLRVSDETKGSIDGNTFTALAVGRVELQLLVNGKIVGSKAVSVIKRPTELKFTKNNINATYGVPEALPLAATYNNSDATINVSDIAFEFSNAKAGVMDGFSFIGDEASGVRNVTILAKLAQDSSISATMSLRLYGADESVFDFENVDAGNTSLAWNRNVANTITTDRKHYYTLTPGEDVFADYVFAIDMKAIVAPVRLQPLMEYLNGFAEGVGENASPWDYLLALGGRVSDLTTITIRATFPEGVTADMSDVSFVNDYLKIGSIDFDEATRTMTLVCKWTRQTAGIDPSTANSIAILSGVKLIPNAYTDSLEIGVVGNVTYDIYLDTSQLHSFAKDPANQAQFGIYDYVNPNDPEDAGGHFADTYINFEDHFVLHDSALSGWVTGGADNDVHYYYVNNEMVTGIYCAQDMEGSDKSYYYDFGEDGRLVGKYTGLFLDQTVQKYRYAQVGVLTGGWVMIGEDWHYFDTNSMNAYTGHQKRNGVYYDFDETGRVTHGVWARDLVGTKYYYGPSYYQKGWYNIDGQDYGFDKGYMLTGIASIRTDKTQPYRYFDFGPDGQGPNGDGPAVLDGIHTIDGTLRYLEDGILKEMGLFRHTDGCYYFAGYQGILRTDGEYGTYTVYGCDIPNGKYAFGSDGKMLVNDIVERDGKLYYYEQGKPKEKGLFQFKGDYYYATYGGVVQCGGEFNTYVIEDCGLPKGTYLFGDDGKMIVNAIVERDGALYYYENGKPTEKGLFKYEGDYYFAGYKGQLKVSGVYGTYKVGECDLPNGQYEFGADGKMLQGIVDKDGVLYYYENGKSVEKGLFKFNGDYYFSVYKGQLKVSGVYGTYKLGECDLPNGQYEFGPDGRMTRGIIEKDGKLYYYENGKPVEKGLFEYNGGYYFSVYKGVIQTSGVYGVYILEDCGLPKGNYEFGPDGRMYDGIIEKDGKLYYYETGKGVEKGLFKHEGAYYFAGYKGELRVNGEYSAYLTACELPKGTYTFDAEGKLLQGIIEKDGKLYYYENGKPTEKGLFEYNGDYYFSIYKGEIKTNGTYKTYQVTPCGIPNGTYEFDAEGKLMQGIVVKDGKRYYYENGKGVEKGLVYYEGHYYYAMYKGELITNRRYNVTRGNGLLIEQFYTFNELGQIVG